MRWDEMRCVQCRRVGSNYLMSAVSSGNEMAVGKEEMESRELE